MSRHKLQPIHSGSLCSLTLRGHNAQGQSLWESALPTSDCSSSLQASTAAGTPQTPHLCYHTPPSPQPDLFSYFTVLFSYIAFPPCFWFCIVVSLVFSTHFHLWICLLAWLLSSFMIPIFILPFLFSLQVCEIHQNTTGHSTALQKDRSNFIHQSTGTSPLTETNCKALVQPTHGEDSINKRNYNLPACRKRPETQWIKMKKTEICAADEGTC